MLILLSRPLLLSKSLWLDEAWVADNVLRQMDLLRTAPGAVLARVTVVPAQGEQGLTYGAMHACYHRWDV